MKCFTYGNTNLKEPILFFNVATYLYFYCVVGIVYKQICYDHTHPDPEQPDGFDPVWNQIQSMESNPSNGSNPLHVEQKPNRLATAISILLFKVKIS